MITDIDQVSLIKSSLNALSRTQDADTTQLLIKHRALQNQKYEDFLAQYRRGEFDPGHIPALPFEYTDKMLLAPRPPDIWEQNRQKHALYYRLLRGAQTPPTLLTQLEKINHFVKYVFKTQMVAVSLISNDTWYNQCGSNLDARELHRDITLCAHAILQRDDTPFIVLDTLQDWRFKNYPQCKNGMVRFYVGVPLISKTHNLIDEEGNSVPSRLKDKDKTNFAIGTLCIADPSPRTSFSEEEAKNLRYCANLVMSEIDFYLCQQQTQEQQCRTSIIAEFARTPIDAIAPSEQIDAELIARAVGRIKGLFYDSRCHGEKGPWPAHYSSAIARQRLVKYIDPLNNPDQKELAAIIVPILLPDSNPNPSSITPKNDNNDTTYLVVTATNPNRVYDKIDADFLTLFANAITVFIQQRMLHRLHLAKDIFLATMSDQLRTPIHGINGLTDILLESEDTNANQRNLLQIMQMTGHSLVSIVNNILNFKDLQNVQLDDKAKDEVNVHTLLQDVLDAHAALMPASMYFKLEDTLSPETHANLSPDFFQQILNHLISNAIKFSTRGEIQIQLYKIGVTTLGFDIQDHGRGMSDEFRLYHLFQPFSREARDQPGIGIGLALCQRYAEAMKATLTLESSIVGQGSKFKLEIPDVLCECTPASADDKFHSLADAFTLTQFRSLYSQFNMTQEVKMSTETYHMEAVHHLIWDNPWLRLAADETGKNGNSHSSSHPFKLTIFDTRDSSFEEDQVELLAKRYKNRSLAGATICFVTTELMVQYVELGNLTQTYFILAPCGPVRFLTTLYTAFNLELERIHQAQALLTKTRATLALASKLSASDVSAMIVDDNAVNRTILSMYFKKRKLPYVTANDGNDAFATYQAQHSRINLILMDYEMPHCDGPSSIRLIRQYEKENKLEPVVIIMVTGLATNESKEYCLQSGASDHYLKPLSVKDIDKLINKFFA